MKKTSYSSIDRTLLSQLDLTVLVPISYQSTSLGLPYLPGVRERSLALQTHLCMTPFLESLGRAPHVRVGSCSTERTL